MPLKTSVRSVSGTQVCSGVTTIKTVVAERHEQTVSVSNNYGGNNPFDTNHFVFEGSMMHSRIGATGPKWEDPLGCPSGFYTFSGGILSLPSVSSADFNRLLGGTNPSNANILIPVFFAELKDLPDLIRQGGRIAWAIKNRLPWRSLIRKGRELEDTAAANLAIQFGWLPFINDLLTISNFQNAVTKRRAMFDKLARKGLRGRMRLGKWDGQSAISYPVMSECGYLRYVNIHQVLGATRWGTVRWTPSITHPLPRTLQDLEKRMLGLTPDNILLEVWEALPWSWLVDYFVNIGNAIKANNRYLATPSHACVMTRRTSTSTHPAAQWDDFHWIDGGKRTYWRHQRVPSTGVLPFTGSFPVLQASQWSILASLYTLKATRGKSA